MAPLAICYWEASLLPAPELESLKPIESTELCLAAQQDQVDQNRIGERL
jgi:hypothetical protein